jgi:cyclopropane fatty-acyl-phospholipid synthase-like methyltransferase
VADAARWTPPRTYDVVVSAEVLEHAPAWRDILTMMLGATAPGGTMLLTCAGPGRAPHSAVDGLDVRPGEHYANVSPADVRALLRECGLTTWSLEWAAARGDLYLRRPAA